LLASLLAALAGAAPAQTAVIDARIRQVENGLLPAVVTPRTVPLRLRERMRELQVPGLSVAVIDRGQLAWAHAWGVAGPGQPMTIHTLMQAASISKPVAAVAALQAVEQGRLGLDTDLNASLRGWQIPPGAQTADRPVTLRRLLSHSAGFTVAGFDGYTVGAKLPTLLEVLDGLPPAHSAPVRVDILPGSQWRYAGGGYAVLQQLLEDIDDQPFAALMQKAVLDPAGMSESFFAPEGALSPAQAARAALGHQNGKVIEGGYRMHPELAAAGLWTTPSDLARFNLALPRLLSPRTLAEALKAQFDQSGLGFVVDPVAGRYGHDGSNAGFESRWLADAQEGGRAIVLMANANGARSLMNEVIRAIAVAQGWTSWMPPTHASLVAKIKSTPLFVRGSLNEWGTGLSLKSVAPLRFAATTPSALPAGRMEFKIASEDWQTVDLGGATDAPITGSRPKALGMGGGNLILDVKVPGRYRFELDATDDAVARLRVTRLP
jgi:CubicO group peptidase (beta-lactamase class C family)